MLISTGIKWNEIAFQKQGQCTIWVFSQENSQQCVILILILISQVKGFPGGSTGKESACNAGDPGSIPSQEDPLEKGMATHSSILVGKFHGQRNLAGYSLWGRKRVRHHWVTNTLLGKAAITPKLCDCQLQGLISHSQYGCGLYGTLQLRPSHFRIQAKGSATTWDLLFWWQARKARELHKHW